MLLWYYMLVMLKFSRQNTKRIVAASLVFWMSGILFLFCCDSLKVQATEAESCPLAKINHCSKQTASENDSQSASVQPEHRALDCCRFLPLVFNNSIKIEKTQKVGTAVANVKVLQCEFSIINREFPAQKTFRPVNINRGNTHLKNCVFRI